MRKTLTLALIAGVMILTPLALRADSITETFTSGLSPSGTTLPATPIPSGLSLFNPAQGTLTGISVTISGTATWASTSSSPLLLAYIDSITGLNSTSQRFNTPGSINISVTGTSTSNPALALFTGTGDYNGTMLVLFVSQLETGDTISASTPLVGKITYDFTPAKTVTPEPASLLLFGTGLLGLAWLARRRRAVSES